MTGNKLQDVNKKIEDKVLIEIAAQHPLIDGKPGTEFEKRLLKGIELYNDELKKGNQVIFYVPGSIHSIKKEDKWVTDENSLSTAGKNFLLEHGIPEECIRSDETNNKYKKDGVYNSGDECLVAKLIADDEGISRIISVVSPVQIDRKALFYLRYGYNPEIYGVGLKNAYHNYIGEAFWSLYITYYIDHTWQESFLAAKTRQERDKNYHITNKIQELLDLGIQIPENVEQKKEILMPLYINAQKNVRNRENNKGTMIVVEINKNDDDNTISKKIQTFMNLYSQLKDQKEIYVYIQGNNFTKFIEELSLQLRKEVTIEFIDTFSKAIKIYNKSNVSDWIHITDSPRVMNESIIAIQHGTLPIMYSVPNDNIKYVDQIEILYNDILHIIN